MNGKKKPGLYCTESKTLALIAAAHGFLDAAGSGWFAEVASIRNDSEHAQWNVFFIDWQSWRCDVRIFTMPFPQVEEKTLITYSQECRSVPKIPVTR